MKNIYNKIVLISFLFVGVIFVTSYFKFYPEHPENPIVLPLQTNNSRLLGGLSTRACEVSNIYNSWVALTLDMTEKEDILVVGSFGANIEIIDITDRDTFVPLRKLQPPSSSAWNYVKITKDGNVMFVGIGSYIEVYNISSKKNPIKIGNLNVGGYNNLILSQDETLLYSITRYQGARIYSLNKTTYSITKSVSVSSYSSSLNYIALSKDEKLFATLGSYMDVSRLNGTNTSPTLLFSKAIYDTGNSLTFSPNNKRIYVATGQHGLHVYDISTLTTATLLYSEWDYSYYEVINGISVAVSNDEKYAFMIGEDLSGSWLKIYDISVLTNIKVISKVPTLERCTSLMLTKDQKYLMATCQSTGVYVFSLDYIYLSASQKSFSMPSTENTIINTNTGSQHIELTPDNRYLFLANCDLGIKVYPLTNGAPSSYYSYNEYGNFRYTRFLQNQSVPIVVASTYSRGVKIFRANPITYSLTLISELPPGTTEIAEVLYTDDKCLFYVSGGTLFIYNVSVLQYPVLLKKYVLGGTGFYCQISRDQNTIFASADGGTQVLDITNRSNPIPISFIPGLYRMTYILKNGKIALGVGVQFMIIDITDPRNWEILFRQTTTGSLYVDVSSDEKTAYLADSIGGVKIYDISDLKHVIMVSSIMKGHHMSSTKISPDGKMLYVASFDNIFLFQSLKTKPDYALIIPQELQVASEYYGTIKLIEISNDEKDYHAISQNYKIIKSSLSSIKVDSEITYPGLPGWLNIDMNTGIYSFFPASKDSIGSYIIYSTFGLEVTKDTLYNVNVNYNSITTCRNELVSRGYLDSDYYLAANFDLSTPITLSSTCSNYIDGIQRVLKASQIKVLTKVVVESSLYFYTDLSSLAFDTQSGNSIKITIQIKSKTVKFVNILYQAQTLLRDDDATIIITGSKQDVNLTLSQLRVHDSDRIQYQGSVLIQDFVNPDINVTLDNIGMYFKINLSPVIAYPLFPDNSTVINIERWAFLIPENMFVDMNPKPQPLSLFVYQLDPITKIPKSLPVFITFDASKRMISAEPTIEDTVKNPQTLALEASYLLRVQATNTGGDVGFYDFSLLIANHPPVVRVPIQQQIDKFELFTGTQFNIILKADSIFDPDNDRVTLKILKEDGNPCPPWLFLTTNTLSGKAPDQIVSNYQFIIVASDGFQEITIPFTLIFDVNPFYVIKLISSVVGPIVGAFGIWIYFNAIYNIIMKKHYQIEIPNPITLLKPLQQHDIYPCAILGDNMKICNYIMTSMKSHYGSKNPEKDLTNEELSDFFFSADNTIQDEKYNKLVNYVKNYGGVSERHHRKVIRTHTYKMEAKLSGPTLDKMIEMKLMLVLQELTLIRIKQNKKLYKIYETIKHDWSSYTTITPSSSIINKFKINEERLQEVMNGLWAKFKYPPLEDTTSTFNLLKLAISSHAEKMCTIDAEIVDCRIESYEVNLNAFCLQKLLRKDMKQFNLQSELGYGIRYKFDQNMIKFVGTPNSNFAGNKLIIQIKNDSGKIFREILIEGSKIELNHQSNMQEDNIQRRDSTNVGTVISSKNNSDEKLEKAHEHNDDGSDLEEQNSEPSIEHKISIKNFNYDTLLRKNTETGTLIHSEVSDTHRDVVVEIHPVDNSNH